MLLMDMQAVNRSCKAGKGAECRKTVPSLRLSLDSGQLGLWEAECGLGCRKIKTRSMYRQADSEEPS
jgi:hypothetical protein